MNRAALVILAALACGSLQAQNNPLIAEMKAQYTGVKNNLVKAAEKIPPEMYAWKPVDTVRTTGALIAHIAGQFRTCAAVTGGEAPSIDVSKTDDKAAMVSALKAAFETCDKAWDSMTDTTAVEMVAGRGGQKRSKLGMLIGTTVIHNNEEYGYLSMYLREKGVVPPSSDRGPM